MQDGEEGRGEEPEVAHEGPLPQALLARPRNIHAPHPPLPLKLQLFLQQQGRDHAAGPARQRGGVHQAAQGPDRRPEAAEEGRRHHRRLLLLLLRRQQQGFDGAACDRGASPGVDAGRCAGERGREAVQAARGDRGAGTGGRRGGQRQLLPRRRQDLLHAPLPSTLPQDRARRRQGIPQAPRPRCRRLHGMS